MLPSPDNGEIPTNETVNQGTELASFGSGAVDNRECGLQKTEGLEWVRPTVLGPDEAWIDKENRRRRVKYRKGNAARAIDNPGIPIRPWMKLLALWMAQQPRNPAKKLIVEQARYFSKARLTRHEINRLLARPDFQKHVTDLMEGEEHRAKALFKSQMVTAIQTHYDSMMALSAAGEHKEVAKFTTPYIDRAYPTKHDGGEKQAQIIINLGNSNFAKQYMGHAETEDADEIVVEAAEVVAIEAEPV